MNWVYLLFFKIYSEVKIIFSFSFFFLIFTPLYILHYNIVIAHKLKQAHHEKKIIQILGYLLLISIWKWLNTTMNKWCIRKGHKTQASASKVWHEFSSIYLIWILHVARKQKVIYITYRMTIYDEFLIN